MIIAHLSDICFTRSTLSPRKLCACDRPSALPLIQSDMMPTTNGPVPRPRMFRMKNSTADDMARIEAGTRWWVIARAGPRYIAANVIREVEQQRQLDRRGQSMARG